MALKINEKVLSGIASSTSPVDREGWLNKKESSKGFVRRWFVLKGNLLFYFEKKDDREPAGVIILVGCRVELDDDDKLFTFKIVFHGMQDRAYVLGAESQDSMELWMKALACAGFDYMKLMVADLQRQIDELEESTPKSSLNDAPKAPPREQRYNPFNRVQDAGMSKQTTAAGTEAQNSSHKDITFHELHLMFGKQILQDREEWIRKKKQETDLEKPLIQF
ncbi:sesquipedalian-1-like [Arctopsyche grandis]|uniref:sesquipedalian-1-like n=1 Tax=Arctopsyche grandis TaxID=121162 RepID=UPI00406DA302